MNLFILHERPSKNAKYHVDRHVVKMGMEATQMLCTVLREGYGLEYKYKSTYINHPVTQWVGATVANFRWTVIYAQELFWEYTYRYGKEHKAELVLQSIKDDWDHIQTVLPEGRITPYHLAVSPEFKHLEPVDAYRAYYLKTKRRLFQWTDRPVPYWIQVPPYHLRHLLQ